MSSPIYRIKDLALRIDRNPLTIKRWEKKGYLNKPRRDSRGWRIYTEEELNFIIQRVKETNYFNNAK